MINKINNAMYKIEDVLTAKTPISISAIISAVFTCVFMGTIMVIISNFLTQ